MLSKFNVKRPYTVVVGWHPSLLQAALKMKKALAIVFMYLIMVVQFQSLRSPFIVMFAVPLAFTGGLLAL